MFNLSSAPRTSGENSFDTFLTLLDLFTTSFAKTLLSLGLLLIKPHLMNSKKLSLQNLYYELLSVTSLLFLKQTPLDSLSVASLCNITIRNCILSVFIPLPLILQNTIIPLLTKNFSQSSNRYFTGDIFLKELNTRLSFNLTIKPSVTS